MKILKGIAVLIILAIVASWLLVTSFVYYVPIGKVGVLTNQFGLLGMEKGVANEDYKAGWHLNLGPLHIWNEFDATVQTLNLTREQKVIKSSRRKYSRSVSNTTYNKSGRNDVRVKSADGYEVSVDVTIKYRIQEGKANKIFQEFGVDGKYKIIVRDKAQKACQSLFGLMKTEEFYNPKERRLKAQAIKEELSKSLKPDYVEVIDVLVKNVQFDPEYERKIQNKKLADQGVELNKSLAASEKMQGKTQVIEATTKKKVLIITQQLKSKLIEMKAKMDRDITRIRADYEKYVTEKKADADLKAAQAEAEGLLLIKTAEANGEKMRNKAMQGVGGSTIVALEAAKNINLTDITISTVDVDLLDLDAMAEKLGAKGK